MLIGSCSHPVERDSVMLMNYYFRRLALVCSMAITMAAPLAVQAQIPVTGETLWFNADDLGPTSGPISQWNDQSNNHLIVSQAVPAAQPALFVDGINGHSYVHFDGVDDGLANNAVLASTLFGYSQSTTFLVFRPDPQISGEHAVTPIAWEQTSDLRVRYLVHSDYNSKIYYEQGNVIQFAGAAPYADQPPGYHGNWHVLSLTRGPGDTASIRLDGVSLPVTGPALASNGITGTELGKLYLGRFNDDPLPTDLAEVLVYPTGLSGADVQSVESYLQGKYFTPVPEPAQFASLFGLGCILGACVLRRRRQARSVARS